MQDEQPKPSEPSSKQPSLAKVFFKGFSSFFWDVVGIKSAGETMTEHALLVEKKGRFLASAFIVMTLAIIGGFNLRGCHDEGEIKIAHSLSESNAVVAKIFESQVE